MIQEYLERENIAPISALKELLGVSEATIRRDLERLERKGILERTRGGAILSARVPIEPAFNQRTLAHAHEKRLIGLATAALIESGDTVFISSGTTTTEVLRALAARRDLRDLTVITNNIVGALEARDGRFEVILLGGSVRYLANSVIGSFATDMLRQAYASKTIIGVEGISPRYGCTTPAASEAEIARLMIERTRGQTIVVSDHSKWGRVSNFEIVPLEEIDLLVSDEGLGYETQEELRGRGVDVLIAQEGSLAARPSPPTTAEELHAPSG
jgi:DeoR family fructose operon transcriptional repressor